MKSVPSKVFHHLFAYYNEIRFNNQKKGDSIMLAPQTDCEFILKRGSFEKILFENTGKAPILMDSQKIENGAGPTELPSNSVFIYNQQKHFDEITDSSEEENTFLWGFDSEKLEMWELENERGASIVARNLTKTFTSPKGGVRGIENLNFQIRPSEFVGIYGNSGTGKTTLIESMITPSNRESIIKRFFKKIASYFPHSKVNSNGEILIDGNENGVSSYADSIAYLPQHIELPKNLKCRELLELALRDRGTKRVSAKKNTIDEKLALCGLGKDILEQKFRSLSGGQQRRMTLVMALLKESVRLLILDEPTTGLDIKSEMQVMKTLRRISRHGTTVITVTHSVAALRLFDKVFVLRKTAPEKGAELSYSACWKDSSFSDVLKKLPSDAEKLSFLSESSFGFLFEQRMSSAQEENLAWPFPAVTRDPIKEANESKKIFSEKISEKTIRFFRSAWRSCCKLWCCVPQLIIWSQSSIKMVLRDKKTLLTFAFLAACCVGIIQMGIIKIGIEENRNLISMMSICAPWLCSTYAAIYMTEQLHFFAWEKFSGLRTLWFILGIFISTGIPALMLALIFSLGMWTRPNYRVIIAKTVANVSKLSNGGKEENRNFSKKYFEDAETLKKNILDTASESTPCFFNPLKQGFGVNFALSQNKNIDAPDSKGTNTPKTNSFGRIFFAMLLVSLMGAAFGLFASAWFRETAQAVIFLVVLFIFFLLNGPLFIAKPDFLSSGPYSIEPYAWEGLLSLFGSFLSISRYIFDLVCNPYSTCWWGISCAMVVALLIAWWRLSNKSKNWRLLSR